MKALVVSTEFPPGPGGIGTHAFELARGLSRVGWSIVVMTSQDYATEREVVDFNRAQSFEVARLRPIPGFPIEGVYREAILTRLVRRHAPDILIASGSRAVLLAAARIAGRGLPWVAVGHGTEFGTTRGLEARAVRAAFRRAAAVVCVSEYTRQQMHRAGIRPMHERTIPNGADPDRFRVVPKTDAETARGLLGIPAGPLLVTVGNVTRRKGQDVVVRALPAILERFPDAHYAIAGLPTLGEEVRQLAAELGVSDHVHLLGRVDESRLVGLLNATDVFVMTSRRTPDGDFEGYGIAVVEAALCGCPAVVSADSGLAEAVEDGRTGLCVPQDDPASTARAVVALLGDEAGRRSAGRAARLRAEQEQTWSHRIALYDDLLRELAFPARAASAASPAVNSRLS
jgi:phosphatidylinositol alpha-1,6-mannosyltransferase